LDSPKIQSTGINETEYQVAGRSVHFAR